MAGTGRIVSAEPWGLTGEPCASAANTSPTQGPFNAFILVQAAAPLANLLKAGGVTSQLSADFFIL